LPSVAERSPAGKECDVSLRVALVVVILSSFAAAQTLTGTVKNSTIGKPSSGDAVVLLSWAGAWKNWAAP